MKITAVIPHYNSPDTLRALLSQLQDDSFDQIYVLDDCSSQQSLLDDLSVAFPRVVLHRADKNVGAGANRNRVLEYVQEGIVWFLDADMELASRDNAQRLRRLHETYSASMIGGLVLNKSGEQMGWNYGHEMHPVHDAVFSHITSSMNRSAWKQLKERGWDYPWLSPREHQPMFRRVDWVSEANFSLHIDIFRTIGGYDTAFRYHEGQDLAKRIRQSGSSVLFEPSIVTRHLEVDVRGKHRNDEFQEAQQLFYRKHYGIDQSTYEWLYS